MPPKEPKWHENEPNDPLKRPKMLRKHSVSRKTQPRRKTTKIPKYAKRSPKMPPKEPKWHENEA